LLQQMFKSSVGCVGVCAILIPLVLGHGVMTLPPARNDVGYTPGPQPSRWQPKATQWFSRHVHVPKDVAPTNCDPDLLTAPPTWGGCDQPNSVCTKNRCSFNETFTPWFAPGITPVESPCGLWMPYGNLPSRGDGRDLPKTQLYQLKAGSIVEFAWNMYVNHGGGYAYRLCPAGENQTEACFQQHHLQFADDNTIIRWTNGTENVIPAKTFTTPTGSSWRSVPIPNTGYPWRWPEFPPPCPGCESGYGSQPFNIVDRVMLPSSLAEGEYTLSWRWDCVQNPQVWTNCADLHVAASATIV